MVSAVDSSTLTRPVGDSGTAWSGFASGSATSMSAGTSSLTVASHYPLATAPSLVSVFLKASTQFGDNVRASRLDSLRRSGAKRLVSEGFSLSNCKQIT